MKYDDSRNPLSPNYRPPPPPAPREPSRFEELAVTLFGVVFWSLATVAVFGFVLLLLYGVIILIFRHAYGVELPNPFAWFGFRWFADD